jgi:hypothetical protein
MFSGRPICSRLGRVSARLRAPSGLSATFERAKIVVEEIQRGDRHAAGLAPHAGFLRRRQVDVCPLHQSGAVIAHDLPPTSIYHRAGRDFPKKTGGCSRAAASLRCGG